MCHEATIVLSLLMTGLTVGSVRGPSGNMNENTEAEWTDSLVSLGSRNSSIPVVKYCCEPNYYFDKFNYSCVMSPVSLEPVFYNENREVVKKNPKFYPEAELSSCPSYLMNSSDFMLLTNGSLLIDASSDYVTEESRVQVLDSTKYCLLWTHESKKNNNKNSFVDDVDNVEFSASALVCFPEQSEEASTFQEAVKDYLLPVSMAISAIFLAATFVVYCLVGELQDLLGKSLMCSVASLCLSKVFGVIARSASHLMTIRACVFIAMLMYLEFLHAFFWVNVISFVIFFSICFQGRLKNHSRKRLFLIGCLYAFGVPLLIMALILIHDFTSHLDNYVVPKPGFGVASCGFTNRGAQLVYFYAPISILLGVNLILFCASACRLFILSKQTSSSLFQFTHYLKLLVLMGIPWIFEVLSFFFDDDQQISAATFFWLAFDIFNALQGVIIFLVFACRRAVFARVAESLCGSSYARMKYPDVFLQHANEETRGGNTQDLRLMDTVIEADNKGG